MQPRKLVLLLTLAMRLPHALRVQVSVKGMTCAACSGAVERALRCAREGQQGWHRVTRDWTGVPSAAAASLFVARNGSTQLHGACRALPGVHKASVALLQEAAEVRACRLLARAGAGHDWLLSIAHQWQCLHLC